MKLASKSFIKILVTLSLVGCSELTNEQKAVIEHVKASPVNDTFTFAQSFESSFYCKDSNWSHEYDKLNRDVVVHKCRIFISNESIEAFKEGKMFVEGDADHIIQKGKNSISSTESSLRYIFKIRDNYNSHTKFISEKCPGIDSQEYYDIPEETRSLCLRSINENFRDVIGAKNFMGKYGVSDLEEAIKIAEKSLELDKEHLAQDEKEIPTLIKEANNEFISQFPKEIEVERVIKITVFPNNNLRWTDPVFISKDRKYQSNGFDITTRQLVGLGLSTKYDIADYLLEKFYGKKKVAALNNFLESKCSEEGCPLNFMP